MAVNLAQVIHQRWAAAAPLAALLPAARVFTGMSVDPTLPFAVVRKESDEPHEYYNDGSALRLTGLRIEVFHSDYDAAGAIAEQVRAAFDRTAFALSGGKVVNMQHAGGREEQSADGVWRIELNFHCTVHETI